MKARPTGRREAAPPPILDPVILAASLLRDLQDATVKVLNMPLPLNDPMQHDVARIVLLRHALEPSKAIEREYQALRTRVLKVYQANTTPLMCPGWSLSFDPKDRHEFVTYAHTQWHIKVNRLVMPPPNLITPSRAD